VAVAESLSIGVNYGQIASNLPSPEQVSWLLRSMRISKVKLYDADPNVLRAFLGTGVEFVVGIGNEYVPAMVRPAAAQAWLQQHVVPYLRAGARITCVTVGNEVFKGNDTALQAAVLPAMQSVHRALGALGLQGRVNITTAHSLDIMGVTFPPSAGAFHPTALAHLQPFLGFLSATRAPFLINCYPYFAYKDDPARVPLDYVLFRPNAAGVVDARTGLRTTTRWTPCTRQSRGSGTRTSRSRCRRPGGRRGATPTSPAPRPSTRGPTFATCCSGSR